VSEFEREVYRSMSSENRCLTWIVKMADLLEYAELLTSADQKLLAKTLTAMVKEAKEARK